MQKLYLNGDHTLVSKIDYNVDIVEDTVQQHMHCALGSSIYFEKDTNSGKYYLYQKVIYYTEELEYLTVNRYGSVSFTRYKEDAALFDIQDYTTGETLPSIPSDSFQAMEATLNPYENGQASALVLTPEYYDGYLREHILAHYEPWLEQKFVIGYVGGQFLACSPSLEQSMVTALLEPCGDDASGEYRVKVIRAPASMYPEEGEPYNLSSQYLCMNPNGIPLLYSDEPSKAMTFGVMAVPPESSGDATPPVFLVTNAPTPTPPPYIPPTPSKASLEVSKTVSGKDVDPNAAFTFTVTLGNRNISGIYGKMTFQNGVATFTLKNGEKVTATGLPGGITYEVQETDSDGYSVTVNGAAAAEASASGTLTAGKTVTLVFNNDKTNDPDKPDDPKPSTDPKDPDDPKPSADPKDPDDPNTPDKPALPVESGSLENPPKGNIHTPQPGDTNVPQTGDSTNIVLWISVLALSAVGLIVLFLMRRKRS